MSKLIAAINPAALLAAELKQPKKKTAKKPKAPKAEIAKPAKAKKPKKSGKTKGKVYVVMTNEPLAVYGSDHQAQLRGLQEKLTNPGVTCRIFEAPFVSE